MRYYRPGDGEQKVSISENSWLDIPELGVMIHEGSAVVPIERYGKTSLFIGETIESNEDTPEDAIPLKIHAIINTGFSMEEVCKLLEWYDSKEDPKSTVPYPLDIVIPEGAISLSSPSGSENLEPRSAEEVARVAEAAGEKFNKSVNDKLEVAVEEFLGDLGEVTDEEFNKAIDEGYAREAENIVADLEEDNDA